ncbi:MAG: delta-class carbonic anhydrase [Mariprofundaceae bacterium]
MKKLIIITASLMLAAPAIAGSHGGHGNTHAEKGGGAACEGFGPQTPRDIDNTKGENKAVFNIAPAASDMNLCNIHFHENAEHKAKDFSIYAGDGHAGYGSGYQCNMSKHLGKAELAWNGDGVCKSSHGDLKPGDTIEVHWVHTTCDVQPGPTLGSCLSKACANPELRVETQVFTLVSEGGLDFNKLKAARDLPKNTGTPVEFIGSTTGPKYSEQVCSPYQVTWNVRPKCAKLNIHSVGEWCKGNVFNEDHAHGVRKLVTNPDLLSQIK